MEKQPLKKRLKKAVSKSAEDSVIRLVAGLGNPGRKYRDTRHNVGFMVLDRLVGTWPETWADEKKWHTDILRHDSVFFLKPQTFMNESGRAVAAVSRFHQISPQQILVVYDDVDLPLGRLRFRADGSAGGHNGIKSIISHLGTPEFPRLKVGIGRNEGAKEMIGHVLGKFASEEEEILEKSLQEVTNALGCALDRGIDAAMNEFNRKPRNEQPKKKKNLKSTSEEASQTGPSDQGDASPEPQNCDE